MALIDLARSQPTARRTKMSGVLLCSLALGVGTAWADEEKSEPGQVSEQEQQEPSEDVSARPALRAPSRGVEEIEIEGERNDDLLKSPISISRLDRDELRDLGVTRIDDIGTSVASLKFDTVTGSNTAPRVFIRGVGQDSAASNFEPGVLLYKDDVYVPFGTGGVFSTFDVEDIEVRRGPQGTRGGHNSVGGEVRFYSRKPQPEFEAFGIVRSESNGGLLTESIVNVPLDIGPLRERAFLRASFFTDTDDGYITNRFDGENVGDTKILAGRVSLRVVASEDLEMGLIWERSRQDQAVTVGKCKDVDPNQFNRIILDTFFAFNERCAQSSASDIDEVFSDDVTDIDLEGNSLTGRVDWEVGGWQIVALSSWRRLDFRRSAGDVDNTTADIVSIDPINQQRDAISQEITLSRSFMGDRLQFSGGLYGFKDKGHTKGGFTQFASFVTDLDRPLNVAPQVPSFLGTAFATDIGLPPLTSIPPEVLAQVGLPANAPVFYFQTIDVFENLAGFSQAVGIPLSPDGRPTGAALDALFEGGFSNAFSDPDFNQRFTDEFETMSYAGYSRASFELTPKLTVGGGIRYTKERKTRRQRSIPKFVPEELAADGVTALDLAALGDRTAKRFHEWSPSADLTYELTEDITIYAAWSRGFRGGGFNLSNSEVVEEFDSETLDTYELGVKSVWFSNRLRLNLTYYYSKFDDMQVDTQITTFNDAQRLRRLNAAEATIQGIDFEFEARPLPNLEIAGGVGYIDSQYDEFRTNVQQDAVSALCPNGPGLNECALEFIGILNGTAVTPNPADPTNLNVENLLIVPGVPPPAGQNLVFGPFADALNVFADGPLVEENVDRSNLRLQNTPRFSYNVRARYTFDMGNAGSLIGFVSWYHQNKTFQNFRNTVEQGKFGVLDAFVAWDLPDGRTRFALYADNLLDRRYITGAADGSRFDGSNEVFFSRPRTLGFSLSRRF